MEHFRVVCLFLILFGVCQDSQRYVGATFTSCGGNLTSSTGYVQSPNYPSNYPNNAECVWIIGDSKKRSIELSIESFHLENNCGYDCLQIRNGSDSTSPLVGKYCGHIRVPHNIRNLRPPIYLKFKTDGVYTFSGFSIRFKTIGINCDADLTSSHGTISSPHYPEMHYSPVTCDWNIRVAAGSVIQFLLVHFEFEGTEDCNLDSVEIYDGSNMGGKKLGTYCQSISHPLYLETTSNVASVRFRTNSAHHGRRFLIAYHTVCHIELHGSTGVIESPNFPNPYPNRENCSWMIVAPVGNTLSLRFSEFDLERRLGSSCYADYLEITEGDDGKPNRQIGKFCNPTGPPPLISSTQRKVMMQFRSDYSVSRHGFRLEWFATREFRNTIQPPSPSCLIWNDPVAKRDDYTYTPGIGGHKLHTEAVPWNEARLTCEEEGGYLAIINSDAELHAITNLFHTNAELFTESQYPNYISIGFHDFYSEGQFVTIHGQSLNRTGFFRWEDGQLDNNERSENCGALSISGELNEVSCENNYAFVCEVPMY